MSPSFLLTVNVVNTLCYRALFFPTPMMECEMLESHSVLTEFNLGTSTLVSDSL